MSAKNLRRLKPTTIALVVLVPALVFGDWAVLHGAQVTEQNQEMARRVGALLASAREFQLRAARQPSEGMELYWYEQLRSRWEAEVEEPLGELAGEMRYFFATALIMVGRAGGEDAVVAFYNPWLDFVLLTAWSERVDGWRCRAFQWRSGGSWRDEASREDVELPVWLTTAEPVASALAETSSSTLELFDAKFPIGADFQFPSPRTQDRESACVALLGERLRMRAALLTRKFEDETKEDVAQAAIQRTREVITSGNQAKIMHFASAEQDPYVAETITMLPQEVRQSMAMHWFIASGDHAIAAFSSALAPRWFIFLFLDLSKQNPARALKLYDFEAMHQKRRAEEEEELATESGQGE